MKVVYTTDASAALRRIHAFIGNVSERAAAKTLKKITDSIDRLLRFPEMAPVEPAFDDATETIRGLVVKPYYKVLYYTAGEAITVVDVWDTRQEPTKPNE
jgi:plasmid stabilization system protein ParE